MDLANCVCIIQYQNAEHKNEQGNTVRDSGLFWVPCYGICEDDVDPDNPAISTPMLLIPWSIGGLATKYPGKIKYTVRFYKLS